MIKKSKRVKWEKEKFFRSTITIVIIFNLRNLSNVVVTAKLYNFISVHFNLQRKVFNISSRVFCNSFLTLSAFKLNEITSECSEMSFSDFSLALYIIQWIFINTWNSPLSNGGRRNRISFCRETLHKFDAFALQDCLKDFPTDSFSGYLLCLVGKNLRKAFNWFSKSWFEWE